jgi:ubiquinone/menaquinone biosynthesis C-methylase UbiE
MGELVAAVSPLGLAFATKDEAVEMSADRKRRRELVTAQYNSAQSAADYASSNRTSGHAGQFFRSRLQLVQDILEPNLGGDLLDAGCGPGVMARALLESRPHDFRITVLDQSPAMVKHAAASASEVGKVGPVVGQLEAMPLTAASFDVTLVMGALEYADARAALREISRVTRRGGLVVVTMLNPLSLYRFTEWFVYWPLRRALEAIERVSGVPAERRHAARATGIRAFPAGTLCRLMAQADLHPLDVIHYDVSPLVPPLDRAPKLVQMAERIVPERSAERWWGRALATAYLITARRA